MTHAPLRMLELLIQLGTAVAVAALPEKRDLRIPVYVWRLSGSEHPKRVLLELLDGAQVNFKASALVDTLGDLPGALDALFAEVRMRFEGAEWVLMQRHTELETQHEAVLREPDALCSLHALLRGLASAAEPAHFEYRGATPCGTGDLQHAPDGRTLHTHLYSTFGVVGGSAREARSVSELRRESLTMETVLPSAEVSVLAMQAKAVEQFVEAREVVRSRVQVVRSARAAVAG